MFITADVLTKSTKLVVCNFKSYHALYSYLFITLVVHVMFYNTSYIYFHRLVFCFLFNFSAILVIGFLPLLIQFPQIGQTMPHSFLSSANS